jgi:queuine tRNA-ribosyltransferase
MQRVRFVTAEDGGRSPRLGRLETARGAIHTPALLPFAANGAVGALTVADLQRLGVQAIAVSLYTLLQRPGAPAIAAHGGLHRFLDWSGPIIADPGDREVAELSPAVASPADARRRRGGQGRLVRVGEEGIDFTSFVDGSAQRLTPEASVATQGALGADLGRSPLPELPGSGDRLRSWPARAARAAEGQGPPLLVTLSGDGGPVAAVGPAVVGWAQRGESAGWPDESGVRLRLAAGGPRSILDAVLGGADLVSGDGALSAAMQGVAFTRRGACSVRTDDCLGSPEPLEQGCGCDTCAFATRGYLHHLFNANEMSGSTLLSLHNLSTVLRLERQVREWISAGTFPSHREAFLADYEEDSSR